MVYKERVTIGLFAELLPVGYSYPIFKGIYDTCKRKKINLRVFLGDFLDNSYPFYPSMNIIYDYAGPQNVDGLISTAGSLGINTSRERISRFFSAFPVPKVSIGMKFEGIHSILVDNRKSLYKLVCHLVADHGYKKIAYIDGPGQNDDAVERFSGYKEALASFDIPFDRDLYVKGDFHANSGYAAAKLLIENHGVKPEVIVCANDNMAVGVINYCHKHGINIPGDIGVTGFDNTVESHYLTPQLTTVAQPLYGFGARAVENLLLQIEGKPVGAAAVMPTALLLRSSCGCPSLNKIIHDTSGPGMKLSEDEKRQVQNRVSGLTAQFENIQVVEHQDKMLTVLDKTISLLLTGKDESALIQATLNILTFKKISEFEITSWLDCIQFYYRELQKVVNREEARQKIDYIFFTTYHMTQLVLKNQLGNLTASGRTDAFLDGFIVYELRSCIDKTDLFRLLKNSLSKNSFRYFYIALYDGDKLGYLEDEIKDKKMRIFIGYDGKTFINGLEEEILFTQEELIPGNYFQSSKEHTFLAYPIVMNDYYFGTLIIDYLEEKIDTYRLLYEQLSISFNMIRLFESSLQKQQELNEINITLEHKVKARTSELTDANRKLREMDRVKTTFFANISHELRTPLTLLLGPLEAFYSGQYGRSLDCDDPVVSSMLANGSRLLKLINNLLDFSKLDAGKLDIQKKNIRVAPLITHYMSVIKSSAEIKGIKTEYVNESGGILAPLDRELFEKAFFNLISNALKFTPRGGTVRVFLKTGSSGTGENTFSIEVHDTGCGINPDKIESIFERFTRLDETEDRTYEGTGIGLAYTKEIAGLHGGTIRAESIPGEGAVFILTLPLAHEEIEASEAGETGGLEAAGDEAVEVKKYLLYDLKSFGSRAAGGAQNQAGISWDTNKKTVCVVDDNPDMRTYLTSILEKEYRVVSSENGSKGLEQITRLMPDLVISDIMMPVMNGLELCRAIKETPLLQHIPVMLLTARMDISGKIAGLEVRADEYLFKPFNARELVIRIENLLTNRKMQIELAGRQNLIMNSVRYAGRIQNALLPSGADMEKQLASHFVYWKPRDIVGGDLYWYKDMGSSFLIGLADCTGHGIPGALMTMITHSLLNRISEHICNDDPGRILRELNRLIKNALNQESETENPEESVSDDGLDIGLCYINKSSGYCIYAGARRPLYYSEAGSIKQISGDRKSVGYRTVGANTNYSNHTFLLKHKDVFFLTTDGYADQLGDEGTFGTSRLKKILLEIKGKPAELQKKMLEDVLSDHMAGSEQIDDITIIGFSPGAGET